MQEIANDVALNPYPGSVAIGDIDADTRPDLVFTERFGYRVAWAKNRSEDNITAANASTGSHVSQRFSNGFRCVLGL
jgi:hypothetical protein